MSKAISYYDWEISFKKKRASPSSHNEENQKTALGIPDTVFKSFLSEWKKKNL